MSKSRELPLMTVVISCFNGAKTIGRTLDSIVIQDYPRDRFAILVVNDGSRDNTADVVRTYKQVSLINLPKNRGLSGARNAGLAAVKKGIYVAMDDDCTVGKDWLRQLAKGYEQPKPAGVGGYLVDSGPAQGVVKSYISTVGCGFAPRARKQDRPASLLSRLLNYLASGLRRMDTPDDSWIETEELYGANGSFPVEVLDAVGGWREEMSGIEDRDLSLRIRKAFPDRHFYAVRAAEVIHDPDLSLKQYLLRPWKRGPVNLRFHITNNLTPPIFPLPFLLVALALAVAIHNHLLVPIALLLLTQILYFWWPYFAIKQKRPIYVLYPYLQLAEECMVIVGLLRGYVQWRKGSHAQY